jgi:hypothetical protein
MTFQGVTPALVLVLAAGLAACRDAQPPVPATVSSTAGLSTAVLGGNGSDPRAAAAAALTDASGRPIPAPPMPRQATAQMVRAAPDAALAVWVQDGRVVSASYAPASGWSAASPLEEIYGQASQPQLASNGQGAALALWRHTVGTIQSLRFSRFDSATGWSVPDVMPGALPRPPGQAAPDGVAAAPQLHMDAQGNAFAQWPSGFHPDEVQTARYVAGRGWTRALSEPVTATASPLPGQPTRSVQ